MKLLFVFGTRPEAIKLAPVIKELSGRENFDCKICVTGQHREMLAQVQELFGLQPDWDLELMRPNQDLAYRRCWCPMLYYAHHSAKSHWMCHGTAISRARQPQQPARSRRVPILPRCSGCWGIAGFRPRASI